MDIKTKIIEKLGKSISVNPSQITEYAEIAQSIEDNKPRYADHIVCSASSFCPYMQFITIDALKKCDHPYNIAENSIFMCFKVNTDDHTLEVFNYGHIHLCEAEAKKTYLCMTGMKSVVKARGGKWMRKSKYKDVQDAVNKICKYYEIAMDAVNDYTGGYPYKQGIGFVDPTENE